MILLFTATFCLSQHELRRATVSFVGLLFASSAPRALETQDPLYTVLTADQSANGWILKKAGRLLIKVLRSQPSTVYNF